MVKTSSSEKTTVLKKGAWSPEEDRQLIAYIKKYKIWNWTEMSKAAGLARSGKSCRLRWVNYLRPDIKHGNFTGEEEETIMTLHEALGNRWSAIAAKLRGRTDNEVKNYWHTHLKKRLKTDLRVDSTSGFRIAELQEPDDEASPKIKNLSESDLPSNSEPAESILSKLEGSEISTVVSPQLLQSSTENFPSLITSSAPPDCVDNYESINIGNTSSETLIHEEFQSLWTQQAPILVGGLFDRPNHDDIQLTGSSTNSQVWQQDPAIWPYDLYKEYDYCYDWVDYIDKNIGNKWNF